MNMLKHLNGIKHKIHLSGNSRELQALTTTGVLAISRTLFFHENVAPERIAVGQFAGY